MTKKRIKRIAIPPVPEAQAQIKILEIISALVSEEIHPYVAAVWLHELKAWICFSDKGGKRPRDAGRRAAGLLLRKIEDENEPPPGAKRWGSTHLTALFRLEQYRELFDKSIAANGGWQSLLLNLPRRAFDLEVKERWRMADTVAEMMDFRFRCLEHNVELKDKSNITHAYVMRWRDKHLPKLSPTAIKGHWRAHKQSAIFLYVAKFGFGPTGQRLTLAPRKISKGASLKLISDVSNRERLKLFFGTCAYVAEKFGDEFAWLTQGLPDDKVLPRLPPTSSPLSPDQLSFLARIKDEGFDQDFKHASKGDSK